MNNGQIDTAFNQAKLRYEQGVEETDSVASDDSQRSRPNKEKKWRKNVIQASLFGVLFVVNITIDQVLDLTGMRGKKVKTDCVQNLTEKAMVGLSQPSRYAALRCIVYVAKLAYANSEKGVEEEFQAPEVYNDFDYTLHRLHSAWEQKIFSYLKETKQPVKIEEMNGNFYMGLYSIYYHWTLHYFKFEDIQLQNLGDKAVFEKEDEEFFGKKSKREMKEEEKLVKQNMIKEVMSGGDDDENEKPKQKLKQTPRSEAKLEPASDPKLESKTKTKTKTSQEGPEKKQSQKADTKARQDDIEKETAEVYDDNSDSLEDRNRNEDDDPSDEDDEDDDIDKYSDTEMDKYISTSKEEENDED